MSSEAIRLGACYGIPKLDVTHRVSGDYCAITEIWSTRQKTSVTARHSPKHTYCPDQRPLAFDFLSSHPVLNTTSFYVPLAYRRVRAARDKPRVRPFVFIVVVVVAVFRSALLLVLVCFARDWGAPCDAENATLDSVEAAEVGQSVVFDGDQAY